jgi:lysozyme
MSLSSEVRTIIDGAVTQLEIDEGFRATPYLDTVGVPTFGHGLTYITQSESLDIVASRLQDLYWRLEVNHPWFTKLNAKRKSVILNMAYNLGYKGLLGFKKMIRNIELGDYVTASVEMLDSKWASQVGERALRLARIMREG